MDWTLSIGGIAGFLSVIVALCLYTHQNYLRRRAARHRHTYEVVGLVFQDSPVARARLEISRWIFENRSIDGDELENPDDDKTIILILDYYEYLCEGAARGDFELDYIDREHGARMERTFFLLRDYLDKREQRIREFNSKHADAQEYSLNRSFRNFLKEHRGLNDALL